MRGEEGRDLEEDKDRENGEEVTIAWRKERRERREKSGEKRTDIYGENLKRKGQERRDQ